jgi:hypothetical protein
MRKSRRSPMSVAQPVVRLEPHHAILASRPSQAIPALPFARSDATLSRLGNTSGLTLNAV